MFICITQYSTHGEEKAAEGWEILASSVWRWSWTNRLLWLSHILQGFRGTKMARGWRNRLQISTRSANEFPWPLTNPLSIYASWVGLHQLAADSPTVMTKSWRTQTTNSSANVPMRAHSSPLWIFWSVSEEHGVSDLPQSKHGQINQSVSCLTECKHPTTTSKAPADTLNNQTKVLYKTLKAGCNSCCYRSILVFLNLEQMLVYLEA